MINSGDFVYMDLMNLFSRGSPANASRMGAVTALWFLILIFLYWVDTEVDPYVR